MAEAGGGASARGRTGAQEGGTPSEGDELGGYRIVRPLGLGGAGDVFLAESVVTGARFALKVLSPGASSDAASREALGRRIGALQALRGRGIVTPRHAAEECGRLFYTMDYVEGPKGEPRTLAQELADVERGKLPEKRARRVALDICEGLSTAHGAGLPHGDLRPEKVLLDRDGRARVTGFLLARPTGRGGAQGDDEGRRSGPFGGPACPDGPSPRRSGPGRAGGRGGPSVAEGDGPSEATERRRSGGLDEWRDIYSLGLIIYRMLTGKKVGVWNVPPSELGCDERWDPVLEKALTQERGGRYSSVAEVAEDLGRGLPDDGRPREAEGRKPEGPPSSSGQAEPPEEPDLRPGEATVEIVLPPEAGFACLARSAVACAARSLGIDEAPARKLDRIVDEFMGLYCSKVSESDDGAEDIRMRLRVEADAETFGVEFRVWDRSLVLDGKDLAGLAFKTIKAMCDEVEIEDIAPEGQAVRALENLD